MGHSAAEMMSDEEYEAFKARFDGSDGPKANVPTIPFPGGSSQADFWREAAERIKGGYPVGGSNVTNAFVELLHSAAAAVEEFESLPSPPKTKEQQQ